MNQLVKWQQGSGSVAEQPVVVASEAIHEPLVVVNAEAKSPNQTGKGDHKIKQAKQPEQKKGWLDSCPTLLSSIGTTLVGYAKSCGTTAKEWTYDPMCKGLEYVKAITARRPATTVACVTVGTAAVGAVAFIGVPATVAGMSAGAGANAVGTAFNMVSTNAAAKATGTAYAAYTNWL